MATETPKKSGGMPENVRKILNTIGIPLAAVVLGLLIGAVLLLISGANPLQAYASLFKGAFGTPTYFQRTLEKATPLIFSGLAVSLAFKAGLFNIGAQGQLLVGAMAAALVGVYVKGLPAAIHIPLALVAGSLAGALYGAIPGLLKTFSGAHEVIVTIMLNYIAINITDYFADGPFKDATPGNIVARTEQILDSAKIPTIGPVPVGFIIAIIIAIFIWWLLWRTTFGFEIRTIGLNQHAAKYAGMRVAVVFIFSMVLSGLLAGMGGAVETQGIVYRYQPGFNAGLGFDGITIALLGRTHPFGVIPASLLIGAMKAGANLMQFEAKVAKEIIDVIQALILFFVAADVIVRKILNIRTKPGEESIKLTTGWGK